METGFRIRPLSVWVGERPSIHTYIVQNCAKIAQSKPSTRRAAVTMGCKLVNFYSKGTVFTQENTVNLQSRGNTATHNDCGEGKHIYVKNRSVYHGIRAWPCHWSPFVWCFVRDNPKSNLCIPLTTQNSSENMSHAKKHNNASTQRILTGIHRLVVTYKGWSAFTSA